MTRAGQQSEGYLILPTEWAGTLVEGNDKEATGKERNLLAQKLARELHGHRWRFVGAEPLGPEVPDYPDWAPSVPRDCSLYRLRRDEHRLLPRPSPELGARQGLAQVGREMDELLGCLIDVRDENERGATRTRHQAALQAAAERASARWEALRNARAVETVDGALDTLAQSLTVDQSEELHEAAEQVLRLFRGGAARRPAGTRDRHDG